MAVGHTGGALRWEITLKPPPPPPSTELSSEAAPDLDTVQGLGLPQGPFPL